MFGKNHNNTNAFTLVEILVALFVFAIVGVIAAVGLHEVLNNRKKVLLDEQRIQDLQIALVLMRRDMTQMIDRHYVSNTATPEPAFRLVANQSINFITVNNPNPLALLPRSNLLHVRYQFKNNELIRQTWPVIDAVSTTKANTRVLLHHVSMPSLNVLGAKGEVSGVWPQANNSKHSHKKALPYAVEFGFNLSGFGVVKSIVPVLASDFYVDKKKK